MQTFVGRFRDELQKIGEQYFAQPESEDDDGEAHDGHQSKDDFDDPPAKKKCKKTGKNAKYKYACACYFLLLGKVQSVPTNNVIISKT